MDKQMPPNVTFKKICVHFVSLFCSLISPLLYAFPSIEGIQVYQQNIHLSPERKQNLTDDIRIYRNANNLWDELRNEFALDHHEDNPLVQEQIDWFMHHQDFLLRSTTQAAPYLYYILQQARKRHLPAEVVLLPVFESSYNPFAYSSAGAAGIWQMMPGTASGYGIRQDGGYDGRRDVIASTKAALNYLTYLSTFFEGNWLFAVAAYDTGEGNVLNAIRRNISNGITTDYWSLPLAQETRTYVPRLLALATIIAHPERYPIYLPPVRNAPYLAQMDVGAQINLKSAASLAGLTLKSLVQLNPGYNRVATSPIGPYKLVLPIENVAQFSENLAKLPASQHIAWQRYLAKSGDTIASIAKHYKTSVAMLRQVNRLAKNTIKPGTEIVIPQSVTYPNKQEVYDDKPIMPRAIHPVRVAIKEKTTRLLAALEKLNNHYILQPGDTIYMVRNGDDIRSVARHFKIDEKTLLAANPYPSNKSISSGDRLVIPTHLSNITEAQQESRYQLMSGDTIYKVRAGDTVETIASKFHTTAPAIRIANLLASNTVQNGDRLVIPTHI